MPDKFLREILNADVTGDSAPLAYETVVECPVCHHALDPRVLCGYYAENRGIQLMASNCSHTVYLLDFCPKCRHMFIAEYDATASLRNYKGDIEFKDAKLRRTYPAEPSKYPFSKHISSVSPSFVETYHQSEAAELSGLLEVAGCGYRKSLEFLVKDYLCYKTPEDEQTIKGEFLGNSVKRIDDRRLQILAERAVWIGNDETHYIRKHDDLDVVDMKRFIKAAVHFVDAELTFEEALAVQKK